LLFSYWIDNLGFVTEGKLAAIFIKPSLGVSNWPVIYIINYTPIISLAPFITTPSSSTGGCWTWRPCGAPVAAAQPARGAPVAKLEDSSDDEWYRPMSPRVGDAGQGSSRWALDLSSQQAPPPQDGDESSNDGGSDYTAFYRRLGT
jgi:hypothetical protein